MGSWHPVTEPVGTPLKVLVGDVVYISWIFCIQNSREKCPMNHSKLHVWQVLLLQHFPKGPSRGPKKKRWCPAKPWETEKPPNVPPYAFLTLRRLTYRNYFIDVEEGEKTQSPGSTTRARSVPTERTRSFSSFCEGAEEELEREKDGCFKRRPADGVLDKFGWVRLKTHVDSVLVSFYSNWSRGVFWKIKP